MSFQQSCIYSHKWWTAALPYFDKDPSYILCIICILYFIFIFIFILYIYNICLFIYIFIFHVYISCFIIHTLHSQLPAAMRYPHNDPMHIHLCTVFPGPYCLRVCAGACELVGGRHSNLCLPRHRQHTGWPAGCQDCEPQHRLPAGALPRSKGPYG